MSPAKKGPASRSNMTPQQRGLLRRWMVDEGVTDYPTIRARAAAHGLPPLTRQLVGYYRQRFITAQECPMCGQALPARASAT